MGQRVSLKEMGGCIANEPLVPVATIMAHIDRDLPVVKGYLEVVVE